MLLKVTSSHLSQVSIQVIAQISHLDHIVLVLESFILMAPLKVGIVDSLE